MQWKVAQTADGWRVRDNNGDFTGLPQSTLAKALELLRHLRDDFVRIYPKPMPSLDSVVPKPPVRMVKRSPNRLPKMVRRCIEQALSKVDSKQRTGCGVAPAAQEAMRLYLDTWAAEPLKAVLRWDEGEENIRDLECWSR